MPTVSSTLTESDWDRFVEAHPESTGYHQWAWRNVFERAFGHRTEYLAARQGDDIVGVLPLVIIDSWLFGRFMVSLPFVNYGGILATTDEAKRVLLEQAMALAKQARLSHVELRHRTRMFDELPGKQHKVAMLLQLPADSESAWHGLQRNVRNHIRKAQKSDLTLRMGGVELLDHFYAVFARNMRDLGTPVYGRDLFARILEQFPRDARLFSVTLRDRPIAASFIYCYRDRVEVPWSSSLREFRDLNANNLMYWAMLEYAIKEGYKVFDFGRSSPGDGPFHFKRQWGAEPQPLHWEYALLGAGNLPDQSPKNPKFKLAIEAWKRMPVGIATMIGPHLVRCIP
jgi:FemAB-related protein (PEP-CTERM system-associated)